jgi:hypothetical protein
METLLQLAILNGMRVGFIVMIVLRNIQKVREED